MMRCHINIRPFTSSRAAKISLLTLGILIPQQKLQQLLLHFLVFLLRTSKKASRARAQQESAIFFGRWGNAGKKGYKSRASLWIMGKGGSKIESRRWTAHEKGRRARGGGESFSRWIRHEKVVAVRIWPDDVPAISLLFFPHPSCADLTLWKGEEIYSLYTHDEASEIEEQTVKTWTILVWIKYVKLKFTLYISIITISDRNSCQTSVYLMYIVCSCMNTIRYTPFPSYYYTAAGLRLR